MSWGTHREGGNQGYPWMCLFLRCRSSWGLSRHPGARGQMDGWLTHVPASLGACFSLCAEHRGWARSLTQVGCPCSPPAGRWRAGYSAGAARVERQRTPHAGGRGGAVATATPAATCSLKPVTQLVSRKRRKRKTQERPIPVSNSLPGKRVIFPKALNY